ncbi:HNH endonuclease [Brevundimonas sp.]
MAKATISPLLFKRLGPTDTGKGNAHTSGPTLTKPIRGYFPDPAKEPGRRTSIEVVLINDDASGVTLVGRGEATVQIQGDPPETYLSDINALRHLMEKDDLLLIEPSLEQERLFTVTRLSQKSPRFAAVAKMASGPAGILGGPPESPSANEEAEADQDMAVRSKGVFVLFDADARWLPAAKRVARSRAFFRRVLKAYGRKCCMCGVGGSLADGRSELEAAHIVSRSSLGSDDVRNGLALCRVHHWAFDRGAVRIENDFSLTFDPTFSGNPHNAHILLAVGSKLSLPANSSEHPHSSALDWHRKSTTF